MIEAEQMSLAVSSYISGLQNDKLHYQDRYAVMHERIDDFINGYVKSGAAQKQGTCILVSLQPVMIRCSTYLRVDQREVVENCAWLEYTHITAGLAATYPHLQSDRDYGTHDRLYLLEQAVIAYTVALRLANGFNEDQFTSVCTKTTECLDEFAPQDHLPVQGACLLTGIYGGILGSEGLYKGDELRLLKMSADTVLAVIMQGLGCSPITVFADAPSGT